MTYNVDTDYLSRSNDVDVPVNLRPLCPWVSLGERKLLCVTKGLSTWVWDYDSNGVYKRLDGRKEMGYAYIEGWRCIGCSVRIKEWIPSCIDTIYRQILSRIGKSGYRIDKRPQIHLFIHHSGPNSSLAMSVPVHSH